MLSVSLIKLLRLHIKHDEGQFHDDLVKITLHKYSSGYQLSNYDMVKSVLSPKFFLEIEMPISTSQF